MTLYIVQRYDGLTDDNGTIWDLPLVDSIHLNEETAQARIQELRRDKYEFWQIATHTITDDTPIFIN